MQEVRQALCSFVVHFWCPTGEHSDKMAACGGARCTAKVNDGDVLEVVELAGE